MIPIAEATNLIQKYGLKQVIIFGWDGTQQVVTTDGSDSHQKDFAAKGGNMMKKAMGWPEEYTGAVSQDVVELQNRIKELESKYENKG